LISYLIYTESFRNYISDLVRLVFNIIHSISKKSHLTKLELAVIKDLADYNFDWFYKKPDRTPFYYLNLSNHSSEEKKSIKGFKKQTLYNDKIKLEKECARCYKILSYNKFFKVNKASNNVRPYCKKCHSELHLIRQYKKKLRVFRDLFGLECSICGKGLLYLPSLVLHHPEVDKKTASWREIRGRSYKFIVNFLKTENVELRCSNCHLKEHATILKHYHPLISKNELFNLKPNEIRSEILNVTKNISGKLDRAHKRGKIREWIKKRYILDFLFDGKCIVCGFNDLAVLELHHRDLKVENKFKWDKIESLQINQINEIIINQDCVCLCSNCHSNFHSRFDEFGREVLQDYYSEKEVQTHLKKISNHYQAIRDKILNFSFNLEKRIESPFEIELKEKDNWKIHILKIFYFINSNDKEIFKAYELKPILNITVRHIYKHLNRLIEKKFVQKHVKIRGAFKFTNSGLNKIREIELSLPSVSKSIQNMFYNKK